MDNERKKVLKQQYAERKPEMGIISYRCGEQIWIEPSKDIKADRNSTLFQLKLGSWRNKEMKKAFTTHGEENFVWEVLKELDYEDPSKDYSEDLELLLLMCKDEYPNAQRMRPGKK